MLCLKISLHLGNCVPCANNNDLSSGGTLIAGQTTYLLICVRFALWAITFEIRCQKSVNAQNTRTWTHPLGPNCLHFGLGVWPAPNRFRQRADGNRLCTKWPHNDFGPPFTVKQRVRQNTEVQLYFAPKPTISERFPKNINAPNGPTVSFST